VGAHTSADRALEVISDRGQDRPAWQANVTLKINSAMLAVFTAIRERCARFMQEGDVMPETS
jgi:hypothetical protein